MRLLAFLLLLLLVVIVGYALYTYQPDPVKLDLEKSNIKKPDLEKSVATNIKPRVTTHTDCGYAGKTRGWYDVQGQGVRNDYCRMVGDGGNPTFTCYLAGSGSDYSFDRKVDPNSPHDPYMPGQINNCP